MQLKITRTLDQEPGKPRIYSTRFRLSEEGPSPQFAPNSLNAKTLEQLAQQWFHIHGRDLVTDANAVLCAGESQLSTITIQALFQGFAFASSDMIVVLAIEERIRRACMMVGLIYAYETRITKEREEAIDLVYDAQSSSVQPIPKLK